MMCSSLSSTKHLRAFWTSANTTRASPGERAEDNVARPSWVGTYLWSSAFVWNKRAKLQLTDHLKGKRGNRWKVGNFRTFKVRNFFHVMQQLLQSQIILFNLTSSVSSLLSLFSSVLVSSHLCKRTNSFSTRNFTVFFMTSPVSFISCCEGTEAKNVQAA